MPRGKRRSVASNLTLEDRLANVQAEIDSLSETMKELKAEKKEIQGQIEEKQKNKVFELFLKSGKTVEDLKELLAAAQPVNNNIEE